MGHSSESSSSKTSSSCAPTCDVDCCEALCTSLVNCRLSSAVVRVHGQTVLTTVAPTAVTPAFVFSGLTQNSTMVETHGSGFLIKERYIVCPASLVSIPPDISYVSTSQQPVGGLTGPLYRYPYINTAAAASSGVGGAIQQVSRILVDVFDVNGKGNNYTYEAYVVGIDGAGNIALLAIDQETSWNGWNPCLECCHPYFRWSKSRKTKPGDPIFFIGDLVYNTYTNYENIVPYIYPSERVITTGVITNNEGTDGAGFVQHEMIVTDIVAGTSASGGVILNNCGAVIGMYTTRVGLDDRAILDNRSDAPQIAGSCYVAGVSEFFMRYPLKAFLQGSKEKKFGRHLGTVTDAIGNFYYYIKGYMGMAWTPVNGNDYSYFLGTDGTQVPAMNNTGAFPSVTCTQNVGLRVITLAETAAPVTVNQAGALPAPGAAPPTAAQAVTYASVPYYAGLNGAAQYPPAVVGWVPDTTNDIPAVPASPLAGTNNPNDIVFEISRCRSAGGKAKKKVLLGSNGNRQVAPGTATWRTMPGDSVYVNSRTYSSFWTSFTSVQVALAAFPAVEDWPWYARSDWPALNATATLIPVNNLIFGPYFGFMPAF